MERTQTDAATGENSMEFPQKIKNGTALWPSDSASGNLTKETQNTNSKQYMHHSVHRSFIYNSQDLEAAQVPISRWVDKKTVVHLHNGILCSRNRMVFVFLWLAYRLHLGLMSSIHAAANGKILFFMAE